MSETRLSSCHQLSESSFQIRFEPSVHDIPDGISNEQTVYITHGKLTRLLTMYLRYAERMARPDDIDHLYFESERKAVEKARSRVDRRRGMMVQMLGMSQDLTLFTEEMAQERILRHPITRAYIEEIDRCVDTESAILAEVSSRSRKVSHQLSVAQRMKLELVAEMLERRDTQGDVVFNLEINSMLESPWWADQKDVIDDLFVAILAHLNDAAEQQIKKDQEKVYMYINGLLGTLQSVSSEEQKSKTESGESSLSKSKSSSSADSGMSPFEALKKRIPQKKLEESTTS